MSEQDADELQWTPPEDQREPALDVDAVLAENVRLRADLADARREVAELRTLLAPVRAYRKAMHTGDARLVNVAEASVCYAAKHATPEEKT